MGNLWKWLTGRRGHVLTELREENLEKYRDPGRLIPEPRCPDCGTVWFDNCPKWCPTYAQNHDENGRWIIKDPHD